jgi:DNA-binding response OmpR family regulator
VAGSAAQARRALETNEPDIVLLDLMLPDADGRDLARELRARSAVPIIMLTARATRTDRIVGLELGADDYVVKPFDTAEVIARIRAVLRRGREQERPPGRLRAGAVCVDVAARRAWCEERELALTRKEFDLLARLLADPGRVVTREDLMSDVWDENWFGPTKTLDVTMATLRRRLEAAAEEATAPVTVPALTTVRGHGYRLDLP